MKVSVVIPVYNGRRYIEECIEGLRRQTHRDLELIVVDDGSTDGSGDFARTLDGVRVIALPQNRGLSVARNVGMAAATGDYIHFMDVDDIINDEFYEELVRAAASTDADIACAGMVHEPKPHRTTIFSTQKVLTRTDEKFRVTRAGVWSYVWRYLFRASFLRECGLTFEPGRLVEDMPFVVPAVFYAGRIVTVPGAIYQYRLIEGSIMQTRSREHVRRRRRDLRHAKEFRHRFARLHNFSIPGVPSSLGALSLLYVKWLT